MKPAALVRRLRTEAGLSVRSLARAAGVASSTIRRIEQGEMHPTFDLLERVAQAVGMRLTLEPELDYASSLVGLARSIREAIARDDQSALVRMAAELVHRFEVADARARSRCISAEPPSTGDERWDAFVAALAEWLAARVRVASPAWARDKSRFLRRGWWVTPMESMRAWEYAGSPISFKTRGVYLHRDSLTNV